MKIELKYNNKIYRTFSSEEEFEQELKKLNSNLETKTSWREFIEKMNSIMQKYVEKSFLIFPLEKYFIVASFETGRGTLEKVLPIIAYIPENTHMRDLFCKILRLEIGGNARCIFSNYSNHFYFIAPNSLLNVILHYNELLSKNIQIYNSYQIKSKNGKIRQIIAPEINYRKTLSECNKLFQATLDKRNSSFQVAYKKGKSIVDNAKIHKENPYIFNMDLKDFFPSCKRELVSKSLEIFFEKLYNGEVLKELFLDAILYNDSLFIGSPVSGSIANNIISEAVLYMKNICETFDCKISVYADDITISSNRFIGKNFVTGIFNRAFQENEIDQFFLLNEKKLKGKSKNKRRITGVSLNDSNELTVKRTYYRELRAALHNINRNTWNGNFQKLRGKIAFGLMVDESDKVRKLLKNYLAVVQNNNLVSNEKLKEIGVI